MKHLHLRMRFGQAIRDHSRTVWRVVIDYEDVVAVANYRTHHVPKGFPFVVRR